MNPIKNILGNKPKELPKKILKKDLWTKNNLDNIAEQVKPVKKNGYTAHVRRVRGGWDVVLEKSEGANGGANESCKEHFGK